jgi:hypothetical protein
MTTLPLRWFASTIQIYSRLCPWLLTWSDYGEDYSEGDDGYNDAGANYRNVSQSVTYRVVGMTWVINAAWYLMLSCRLALRGDIILVM